MDTEFLVLSPAKDEYDSVEIHVTGFGKFGTVENNPTSVIVASLEKVLADHPISKFKLGSAKILKVSAKECIKAVNELVATVSAKQKANPKTKHIIVHLGVSTANKIFYVETKGFNGANFAHYPDADGYKPDTEVILKGVAYNHPLESIMPCSDIVFNMQGNGTLVDVSDNPGSYVCNYIYYVSLYKTLPLRIPSVFVHVPPFSTIGEEDQFAFVHAFFTAIRDTYTEE